MCTRLPNRLILWSGSTNESCLKRLLFALRFLGMHFLLRSPALSIASLDVRCHCFRIIEYKIDSLQWQLCHSVKYYNPPFIFPNYHKPCLSQLNSYVNYMHMTLNEWIQMGIWLTRFSSIKPPPKVTHTQNINQTHHQHLWLLIKQLLARSFPSSFHL